MQRGHDVHVLDLATTGVKPELVRALGATYESRPASELGLHPSIVVECTGVAPLIRGATETARRAASCASPASAARWFQSPARPRYSPTSSSRTYLADSGTATVDAFAFDPASGALTDRRTIVRVASRRACRTG